MGQKQSSKKYGKGRALQVTCFSGSRRGRRPRQEDAHQIRHELTLHPSLGYYGVFDGHNGSEASRWCAGKLHKTLDSLLPTGNNSLPPEIVQAALREAYLKTDAEYGAHCDKQVRFLFVQTANFVRDSALRAQGVSAGTTAVVVVVDREREVAVVGNLGDSR